MSVAEHPARLPGVGEDGCLVPDPAEAPVVEAFRIRADGGTVADVREHLAAHGIDRSYHGDAMLTSRVYLGEIHFGRS